MRAGLNLESHPCYNKYCEISYAYKNDTFWNSVGFGNYFQNDILGRAECCYCMASLEFINLGLYNA